MASTAEDAANHQDATAERLLGATALAVQRARIDPEAPEPPDILPPLIEIAIFGALVSAAVHTERRAKTPDRIDQAAIRHQATEMEPRITEQVWNSAKAHAQTSTPDTDRQFTRDLARSAATAVASQTAEAMGNELGFKYKVWITRGDEKVRPSHRALHGRPVELANPFKRWPDGQVLDYPGDTRAPMDEWINCRCMMFMSPTKAGVAEALAPADLDKAFALAASLEQRWNEDDD